MTVTLRSHMSHNAARWQVFTRPSLSPKCSCLFYHTPPVKIILVTSMGSYFPLTLKFKLSLVCTKCLCVPLNFSCLAYLSYLSNFSNWYKPTVLPGHPERPLVGFLVVQLPRPVAGSPDLSGTAEGFCSAPHAQASASHLWSCYRRSAGQGDSEVWLDGGGGRFSIWRALEQRPAE